MATSTTQSGLRIYREGLSVLNDPSEAQLDIVFVHGLNGHPYTSWRDEESQFYWPVEIAKLIPSARIMAFGYIADFGSGSSNQMGVRQHAESLMSALKNMRQRVLQHRPVVFVCHSLGGIVVKQVLILSSRRIADRIILESTKLMVFLGTPHQGSHMLVSKRVSILEKMAKLALNEVPPKLRAALLPRSEELFAINDDFANLHAEFAIVIFYEQKEMAVLGELIVDRESATLHGRNIENIPLHRDHRELIRFRSNDEAAYHQVAETIHRKIEEILEALFKVSTENHLSELREAFLLSQAEVIQSRLFDIAEPSATTLNWLVSDEAGLFEWFSKESGIFWVSGKPGSGKSVLMKEIYARVCQKNRSTSIAVTHHFFNNRGSANEHSFEGFLRSILAQIVQQIPALFGPIAKVSSQCLNSLDKGGNISNKVQWTLRSLKDALNSIVETESSVDTIFFIVDALDECSNILLGSFKGYMDQLCKRSRHIKLKFVVSSRHKPENTQRDHSHIRGFCLQDINSSDIANYVNERWAESILAEEVTDDLIAVKNDIIKKADGIFLWVKVVMSELERGVENGDSLCEIRGNLNSIPTELNGVFDVLLGNIEESYMREAQLMFSIVLSAAQPLTLDEFCHALLLSQKGYNTQRDITSSLQTGAAMRRRLRSRSGGLIETRAGTTSVIHKSSSPPTVQFIHQSVKDYVLETQILGSLERGLNPSSLVLQGQRCLSIASLRYLRLADLENLVKNLQNGEHGSKEEIKYAISQNYPLLEYAATFWVKHYSEAEKLGAPPTDELEKFISSDYGYFDTWRYMRDVLPETEEETALSIFDLLFDRRTLEAFDTPLQFAVQNNFLEFVRRQLEKDCGAGTTTLETRDLIIVSCQGDEEMCKLLINNGVSVNAAVSCSVGPITALSGACFTGKLETVKLLLENGADVSFGTSVLGPLAATSCFGRADILEVLLQHDPDLFDDGNNRHISLILLFSFLVLVKGFGLGLAIFEDTPEKIISDECLDGTAGTFELLTRAGLDSQYFPSDVLALFQWCIINNSDISIDSLVARGVLTDLTEPSELFMFACLGSDVEVVRSLVRHGIDPKCQRSFLDFTVIHAASANPSVEPLEFLLGLGLDPNENSLEWSTPLHTAASYGSDTHIEILLGAGARVGEVDASGFYPLHYAVANPRVTNKSQILDALTCQPEVTVNSWKTHKVTPLHTAAKHGSLLAIKWLLSRDVDIRAEDGDGRTALHAAAANGNDLQGEMINLFVQAGLDVNSRDDSGTPPLHNVFLYTPGPFEYAVALRPPDIATSGNITQSHQTKVRILLSHGANVNAQDDSGTTALHIACAKSNRIVVKYLISMGADPGLKDARGCTPMDVAKGDVRTYFEGLEPSWNRRT